MTSPDDFYAKAVADSPWPSMEGGASGYFSAPQEGLDPNLFDGTKLHPEIGAWLKRQLWGELVKMGLKRPGVWTHIWLTGSGISYQWAADRGNGDLDVVFGVDFPSFLRENQDWGGMSEDQFAGWLNTRLKEDLWPNTASAQFGDQHYEVTFYLNPAVGRDISRINPYAAYDIRLNSWTVTPPKVAADPASMYPAAWFNATNSDADRTHELLARYQRLSNDLDNQVPGTGPWHNTGSAMQLTVEQAHALWEEIHGGRHEAFQPGGHGYGDYHNFRWQQAKANGVVHALKGLRTVRKVANEARDVELYGGPIAGADEALSRAALVSRERPGMPR